MACFCLHPQLKVLTADRAEFPKPAPLLSLPSAPGLIVLWLTILSALSGPDVAGALHENLPVLL